MYVHKRTGTRTHMCTYPTTCALTDTRTHLTCVYIHHGMCVHKRSCTRHMCTCASWYVCTQTHRCKGTGCSRPVLCMSYMCPEVRACVCTIIRIMS